MGYAGLWSRQISGDSDSDFDSKNRLPPKQPTPTPVSTPDSTALAGVKCTRFQRLRLQPRPKKSNPTPTWDKSIGLTSGHRYTKSEIYKLQGLIPYETLKI